MKVNGVANQAAYEKISTNTKAEKGKNGTGFYESLAENMNGSVADTGKTEESGKGAEQISNLSVQSSFRYQSASSVLTVHGNGQISASAAFVCAAKHISYEESDYVASYVEQGFVVKAQVNVSAHTVYLEQKMEDGSVNGYEIGLAYLDADSDDPIIQTAAAAWEMARRALMGDAPFKPYDQEDVVKSEAGAETTDADKAAEDSERIPALTDMTVEEALLWFYDFIQNRIENGPPKYAIGNSEFSIEEWDKLIEDVDEALDAIREAMREEIAKRKAEAEQKDQNESGVTSTSPAYGENSLLETRKAAKNGVPYYYLAKDDKIEYNGVTFICDTKRKAICLGDVSDMSKCLKIGLSGGGFLIVNRDNLGDLAKAIGMFSPEDVNIILRAIAQDAKIRQVQQQIDETASGETLVKEIEDDEEQDGVEEFLLQALLMDMTPDLKKEDF